MFLVNKLVVVYRVNESTRQQIAISEELGVSSVEQPSGGTSKLSTLNFVNH